MIKLSQAQTELLQAAATAPGGGLNDADRRTAASLIKRGFAISIPKPEGGSRLMITEAGRGAVGPGDGSAGSPEAESGSELAPSADSPTASHAEPPEAPAVSLRAPPKGKLGALVELLRRPEGARVDEMMQATGWQAHSVRGAMSGSLKKALSLTVTSEKTETGRVYRIVDEAAA